MPFEVRPVRPAETRPLRQAGLRPHQTLEELAAHEPAGAYAVGAFTAGGELAAVGLIGPDGQPGGWRIRGMVTRSQDRGSGAGTAVLAALFAHAHGQGARRIWCNARLPAISLYARAGMEQISDRFELPQIGAHVVMEWRSG
jgi:GNAT superfamily N-acetyltransferase